MNDQLQTTVADILQALKSGAEQYGPQALDVALSLKRVEGIGQLVTGLVLLIAGLLIFSALARSYRKNGNPLDDADPGRPMIFAVGGIGMIGLICEGGGRLFDIWNWAAAFRPDLALAHDVLLKLTGQ